jgi:RNA ligase
MNIDRLFDTKKLDHYIRDGYISARRHPHLPLTIYNYTPKTQFDRLWDEVTRHCRGLIVDWRGEVIGNCLKKFFNYNEPDAEKVDITGPVQVTDKLDGSYLGVCLYEGIIVTATRGSFESEQAKVAQQIIDATPEYQAAIKLICADSTAVFEVIYPENRIVLDYGPMRDIVLIGTIANFELTKGRQLWTPAEKINWPGQSVVTFDCKDFATALRMLPRENAEGIVVYFENSGHRLKIKQERYIELHKLIFNLTPKRIWERRRAGETLREILINLPEEFHDPIKKFDAQLGMKLDVILQDVDEALERVYARLPEGWTRRDFAAIAQHEPYRHMLFQLLDKDIKSMLDSAWKLARPVGDTL